MEHDNSWGGAPGHELTSPLLKESNAEENVIHFTSPAECVVVDKVRHTHRRLVANSLSADKKLATTQRPTVG